MTALHDPMVGLFEGTKDHLATRIIALQALYTIITMHVQNKNLEAARQTIEQIPQHISLPSLSNQESNVIAEMLKHFRDFALSSVAPEDLTALHESMLKLFEDTKAHPATRIIALRALY
ncbi:MAG: hypothetical protein LBJ75_02485, partial [Puniceicoccales bacterium]|nr:hypothetical protein [Puniceicoccales bacterium]